jgi:hypothetical protein
VTRAGPRGAPNPNPRRLGALADQRGAGAWAFEVMALASTGTFCQGGKSSVWLFGGTSLGSELGYMFTKLPSAWRLGNNLDHRQCSHKPMTPR